VSIAAGGWHSLALTAEGTVIPWGSSDFRRSDVPLGLTNVIGIADGPYHSLALVGDGPPVLQVPITSFGGGPNGFTLSLPTQSGRVYALEYKNTLTDGHWTALPLIAGNGGVRTLTDPTAMGQQRFYRVRRW
jgi:hypothetical protein